MSFAKAGLALAVAGAVAVVAFGQLPNLNERMNGTLAAPSVFAPMSVQTLSEENMVDAFAGMRLESSIRRLTWEQGILTVDLAASREQGGAVGVWKDAAALIELSFGKVHNVRQLLIRVFSEEQGKRLLLFSADSRAADWSASGLAALQDPIAGSEPVWAPKIRPDWTRAGAAWRRNFANS